MKEIILWAIVSGLLLVVFLTLLLFGIFRKNRTLIIASIFTIVAAIGSASWTVYLMVNKSYLKVTETLKPRTGREIYIALFGKPKNDCVKVLNYQDQVIPKIDYAIWLNFESCPEELNRILKRHIFKGNKVSLLDLDSAGPSWFKPQTLGDSVMVFVYNKDEYGNGQTIYSSRDSTEVFCKDVLD